MSEEKEVAPLIPSKESEPLEVESGQKLTDLFPNGMRIWQEGGKVFVDGDLPEDSPILDGE